MTKSLADALVRPPPQNLMQCFEDGELNIHLYRQYRKRREREEEFDDMIHQFLSYRRKMKLRHSQNSSHSSSMKSCFMTVPLRQNHCKKPPRSGEGPAGTLKKKQMTNWHNKGYSNVKKCDRDSILLSIMKH